MAGTKLTDVIVPELFNPYVMNKNMELSALVQSGIVANNSEFDKLASQAAPIINMPFFEDLTGESEQIIENVDLEDNKITSNKDMACIIRRAKMWSATDLSAALAGTDPMGAIACLAANFWARDTQKELIAILKGIFGTVEDVDTGTKETRLLSNLLDISGETGDAANWSVNSFIDAQQLLGDAQGQLTAGFFNSPPRGYFKKKKFIDGGRRSVGGFFFN